MAKGSGGTPQASRNCPASQIEAHWHAPEQIRAPSVTWFEQGIENSRFLSICDPLPLKHAPHRRQGPQRTGEPPFLAREFEPFWSTFSGSSKSVQSSDASTL